MDVKPKSGHGQSVPGGTCDRNDLPGQVDLLRRVSPLALWAAYSCGPLALEPLLQQCADYSLVPLQVSHVNCASIFVLQNRLHALTANVFSNHERGLPSCEAALLCLCIRPDGLAQKP